jgi:hypothetical protein
VSAPKAPRDGLYRVGDRELRLNIGDMLPEGAELVPGQETAESHDRPETDAERGETLARYLEAAGYELPRAKQDERWDTRISKA